MSRPARGDLVWLGIALGCVGLTWLYPLLLDPRHYFQGDTQNAYYGWFHHLGDAVLHGRWPMLDAQAGSAGNPLAEGQEGLYSPLSWLIGIGATVAPQVVVYATLVKLVIAAVAVTGCYLLARGYGVRPELAAVAAVAAQLGGFTLSADAPRWVAGQLVAALLPWAWWAARRTVAGANPWPLLVSTFLLVTTGYVFGTMYLGLVIIGLMLEALLNRDWPGVRRLLLLSAYVALLCVTVYLPGILTAPVTWRDEWGGDGPGFLEMGPVTLLLTGHPTTVSPTVSLLEEPGLGADQVTFTYVAWFLPLVCWVVYSRLRHEWRSLVSIVVPLVLATVWTLLPQRMGPIRMPGRVMSVVTLCAVLLVVVLLDRALARSATGRPSLPRVGLSLLWVAAATIGATLLRPSSGWLQVAAGGAVAACVVATFLATPRRRLMPAVMIAASAGIAVLQLTAMPAGVGGQRGSPGALSTYADLLPGARGDVLVIGLSPDVLEAHPEIGRSVLPGSLWDLTGKPVHNGYTTLGFRDYNYRFCIRFNGDVCPEALDAMLETEPTTGLPWADLHAISTLVLVDLPPAACGTAARRLAGRPRPGPRGHLGPRPSAADGRRRGLVLGRHPCPRGLSQRDQHDLRRRSGRWPGRQRGVEPDRLARLPGGGGEVRRSARRAPRPGGAHDGRRRLHRDGSLPTARLATRARRPRRGDPARARLGPEARHVDQGPHEPQDADVGASTVKQFPTAQGRLGA